MIATRKISCYEVTMGCDPEFFLSNAGKIIEAKNVIPEDGVQVDNYTYSRCGDSRKPKIIIDGVQAELNPRPYRCRANLANEIADAFRKLRDKIQTDNNLGVSFASMVEFSDEDLKKLSDKAKVFGCAPSSNYYTNRKSVITVDASKYNFRSAGGHIHLGVTSDYNDKDPVTVLLKNKPKLIVPILDTILGNTCVMIDRDPYQKERRKVYGRAGEYRRPSYGVEYRTLSNFWLRSYPLMSMVFGFSRLAVSIGATIVHDEQVFMKPFSSEFRKLLRLVPKSKIRDAINNNDFNLAKQNWNRIKKYLMKIIPEYGIGNFPLCDCYLGAFDYFIDKGIDYWFKDDPLKHWTTMPEGHGRGWEHFLIDIVTPEFKEANKKP